MGIHPNDKAVMNERARIEQEKIEYNQATAAGVQQATEGTINVGDLEPDDIIDELSSPDIGRGGDDQLEELLTTEFARHLAFGNISKEEWERQRMLDMMRARLVKCEYPRQGRIGSRCRGLVRDIMVPDEPERPVLDDDTARRLDAAFEERSLERSLSIDAKGFRGVTEAIVETRSRRDDGGEDSTGGILSRTVGRVFN